MSEFKCKCIKCNKEESFSGLKEAYMNGWFFGRTQMCHDCEKNKKHDKLENIVNIPDELIG
jgi:hypothetical protein